MYPNELIPFLDICRVGQNLSLASWNEGIGSFRIQSQSRNSPVGLAYFFIPPHQIMTCILWHETFGSWDFLIPGPVQVKVVRLIQRPVQIRDSKLKCRRDTIRAIRQVHGARCMGCIDHLKVRRLEVGIVGRTDMRSTLGPAADVNQHSLNYLGKFFSSSTLHGSLR